MLQNRLIQYLVIAALLLGIADLALNFYTGTYGAIKARADAALATTTARSQTQDAPQIGAPQHSPKPNRTPAQAARLKEIEAELACLEKPDAQIADCEHPNETEATKALRYLKERADRKAAEGK